LAIAHASVLTRNAPWRKARGISPCSQLGDVVAYEQVQKKKPLWEEDLVAVVGVLGIVALPGLVVLALSRSDARRVAVLEEEGWL